jgi:hypothetical protein
LREGLDAAGFKVGIMSYSAKYASAFTDLPWCFDSAPVDSENIPTDKRLTKWIMRIVLAIKEALVGCRRRCWYGYGKTRNSLFGYSSRG